MNTHLKLVHSSNEESSSDSGTESDRPLQKSKRIFAAAGIFAVLFVISRVDVAVQSWIEDRAKSRIQFEYADEYQPEHAAPSFFDRLFCMGLKRAQSCE